MDPQFAFASSADIWRLQDEMKNVYATQAEHSDRLLRLERRQDDDSRLRSVWGNSSPFPSILSGTPQQGKYTRLKFHAESSTDASCHRSRVQSGLGGFQKL